MSTPENEGRTQQVVRHVSGKHAREVITLLKAHPEGLNWEAITTQLGIHRKVFELTLAFIREYDILEQDLLLVCEGDYRYRLVDNHLPVDDYIARRYDWFNTAMRRLENLTAVDARKFPNDPEIALLWLQARRLHEDIARLANRGNGASPAAAPANGGNGGS